MIRIHPLGLLDLLSLGRFRRDMLILDSAKSLTCGNPLGFAALLAHLDPGQRVYTVIGKDGSTSLIGQVRQENGETFARLSFLAPCRDLGEAELVLLDRLAKQVGAWGAFYLLGEIDERSSVFRTLRRSGFSMYAWQKIWRLQDSRAGSGAVKWHRPSATDMPTVERLYNHIVPVLIQPVTPSPREAKSLLYGQDDKLLAHVALTYGPYGVLAHPLVDPDAEFLPEHLRALLHQLPKRHARPVYLCVRSYQAWLEPVLEESGAEPGPRQAVMVKHLAASQRDKVKVAVPEKALAKPAAPAARSSTKRQTTGNSHPARQGI